MRILFVSMVAFLCIGVANGQSRQPYGLPELGLTFGRSSLRGPLASWTTTPVSPDKSFFARPEFDFGVELNATPPLGVRLNSEHGLMFDLGQPNHWLISLVANLQAADPLINGMQRPGMAFAVGVAGEYTWDIYQFRMDIRHVSPFDYNGLGAAPAGSGGWLSTVSASAQFPLTQQITFSAQAKAAFADANFNNTYYGVSAAQAKQTGFAAYEPVGGFIHGGVTGTARYLINRDWEVQASGHIGRYLGPASESPIIEQRGQLTTDFGLSLIHRF